MFESYEGSFGPKVDNIHMVRVSITRTSIRVDPWPWGAVLFVWSYNSNGHDESVALNIAINLHANLISSGLINGVLSCAH